jgi:integrase
LGKQALAKLTAQHIEMFYTRKLADGAQASAIRFCHKVLRAALTDAVRLGLIYRNVASLVKPPRARTQEMAVYTEEQVTTLLKNLRGARLGPLIVMALATGMREGELLALRWQDIDFERATVLVHANLIWTPQEYVFEEAKTPHSRRRIALPQIAVKALEEQRAQQASERTKLDGAWHDLGLVFANTLGGPYDASNLRNWFYRMLERAALPRIRFHDLRHTAATLLLARGVHVKVVSEMLGHANIGITLAIYGHVLPHMQQYAADTMNTMLQGSREE